MHAYSSDSSERIRVPLYIGSASILAAWLSSQLVDWIDIQLPWWVGPPSALGIFGALFIVFDNKAWRWGWIRAMLGVKTPNLTGKWKGQVTPEDSTQAESVPVEVDISQKWSSIAIDLSTDQSMSRSEMASLFCLGPKAVLSYQYLSEPRPGATVSMEIHRGTARLELLDTNVLDGSYYTGRGRRTQGRLTLNK